MYLAKISWYLYYFKANPSSNSYRGWSVDLFSTLSKTTTSSKTKTGWHRNINYIQ